MSDNAIWTQDGIRSLDAKPLERVELIGGQIQRLIQFADVASAFHLGIRCLLCNADLLGKNAPSDRAQSIACGCRDFRGTPPMSLSIVVDVMSWMKTFEEMLKSLKLQLYCSRCNGDMKRAVSSEDRAYSVACPCRELKPKWGGDGHRVSRVQ